MKEKYKKPIISLEEIMLEDVILTSGIIINEGSIDISDVFDETL